MPDTQIIQGKVKTVFTTSEPNEVLIQYEDKVTAGNGRKVDFPEGKGRVCCQISEFLFEKLEEKGVRTHYISTVPVAIMCCKKVDIIPIEVVVRNVAAGSIVRQTTLEEGQIINWPLVEYYLKDDEKDDPLLTEDRINLMGYGDVLKDLESIAREVNSLLKSIFHDIDLTLVDFKLEFGYDADGNLLLADELSPDGMRLWKKGTSESYDKDLFRKDEGDIVNTYQYILRKLKEADSCTEI
jgi:phosphoribosylaminoimidazole-succinocarboxamide synthase